VFLSAKHQVRIYRICGVPVIAIAGIAGRALCRAGWQAVDEQLHKPIQSADGGNVMPLPIANRLSAAQSRAGRTDGKTKGNYISAAHRDAEVAEVAAPKDVAIDDGVRRDPAVVGAARSNTVVST
jgi:hypothetical protein